MRKALVMGLVFLMGAAFFATIGCVSMPKPNVRVESYGSQFMKSEDLGFVKRLYDFVYRVEFDKGKPKRCYTNVKPVEGKGCMVLFEVYVPFEDAARIYDIKTKEYLGVQCTYYPSITTSNGAGYKIFQQK